MITVTIYTEKTYPVTKRTLSKRLADFFVAHGIKSTAEASVYIVSKETMLMYVKKHLQETGQEAAEHPVLSFVNAELEGPFQFPPDEILHLGEIIVSFDHAKVEAAQANKTPEECVIELAEHSALHLMGIHHD